MAAIFLDYTGGISDKVTKFHGGGYYAKRTILSVMDSCPEDWRIVVFWPASYEIQDEYESRIYHSPKCQILPVESLNDIQNLAFPPYSIVLFPLIRTRSWRIFKELKKRNQNLRIYAAIHGLRVQDLQPDRWDNLYLSSARWRYPVKVISYWAVNFYLKFFAARHLKYLDKIFTVSNYSLQAIARLCAPKFIKAYYPGACVTAPGGLARDDRAYILFVSGERREKNLARALRAFLEFKKTEENQIYFYITGISPGDYFYQSLIRFFQPYQTVIDRYVRFLGYVDRNRLDALYRDCLFLLYPSKSEGFGMPVLEALLHGRPTIASWATSIPEVAGSLACYVNPYDCASIRDKIAYMCQEKNRKWYEEQIKKMTPAVKMRIEAGTAMLVYDILH